MGNKDFVGVRGYFILPGKDEEEEEVKELIPQERINYNVMPQRYGGLEIILNVGSIEPQRELFPQAKTILKKGLNSLNKNKHKELIKKIKNYILNNKLEEKDFNSIIQMESLLKQNEKTGMLYLPILMYLYADSLPFSKKPIKNINRLIELQEYLIERTKKFQYNLFGVYSMDRGEDILRVLKESRKISDPILLNEINKPLEKYYREKLTN